MSGSIQPEQQITTQLIYDGTLLRLRRDRVLLSGGRESWREVVEHAGAVAVLPVTREGKIVLVRQYRYAVGRELLEIPAGLLEPGESPQAAARRELREETGYRKGDWRFLTRFYPAPGFTDEIIHMFLALGVEPGRPAPDADEAIATETLVVAEARNAVETGRVADGKTLVALLWWFRALDGESVPGRRNGGG